MSLVALALLCVELGLKAAGDLGDDSESEAYDLTVWGVDFWKEAATYLDWTTRPRGSKMKEPKHLFEDILVEYARMFKSIAVSEGYLRIIHVVPQSKVLLGAFCTRL